MQLHQSLFAAASISGAPPPQVVVLTFVQLQRLRAWRDYLLRDEAPEGAAAGWFANTIFAIDPQLRAYHAYGLGRNSILRVYGPRMVWQYIERRLRGIPFRKATEDTLQRGGDFVVGTDGRLLVCHVGRDQADRAPVMDLMRALGVAGG